MDDAGVDSLRKAIFDLHGVDSEWLESVPVREEHEGRVIWAGEVQVFRLKGHPAAELAYVWSYPTTGTKRRFLAVLGVPPVDGPVEAVRASVVADARRTRS
jgi:hypothetical protein